jgi:predicted O-methyltransferase YrrM
MVEAIIEGQINAAERQLLTDSILKASKKPQVVIEVGTWLGGGSTVTFLRALRQNGAGHLWGVEADRSIYDRMMANLTTLAPEVIDRFTPLFGLSDQVLPLWISEQKKPFQIDVVFLDGGDNPSEQIAEFEILDPHLPVGAQLFSHDANFRKGKWLIPYLSRLDNWEMSVLPLSPAGLMAARKIADQPSTESLRAARAHLFKMRWEPIEIVARFSPKGLKRILFSVMPQALALRLAGGKR